MVHLKEALLLGIVVKSPSGSSITTILIPRGLWLRSNSSVWLNNPYSSRRCGESCGVNEPTRRLSGTLKEWGGINTRGDLSSEFERDHLEC